MKTSEKILSVLMVVLIVLCSAMLLDRWHTPTVEPSVPYILVVSPAPGFRACHIPSFTDAHDLGRQLGPELLEVVVEGRTMSPAEFQLTRIAGRWDIRFIKKDFAQITILRELKSLDELKVINGNKLGPP